MKKTAIILAVIIIVLLGVLIFVPAKAPEVPPAGSAPAATSTAISTSTATTTPPIVSSDGQVTVTAPRANDMISSPVTITGSVTGGGWFFEAVFPVTVVDANRIVLGKGQARAQSDWTTTGTVPFVAKVTFVAPPTKTGFIVLESANPSGIEENLKSLSMPITFRESLPWVKTAVNGKVQLGPTCPVETNPPTPGCEPKPYPTTISIFRGARPTLSDTPMQIIQTDASANFTTSLAPGDYWLEARSGSPYPRCEAMQISVSSTPLTGVTLNCDTCIR